DHARELQLANADDLLCGRLAPARAPASAPARAPRCGARKRGCRGIAAALERERERGERECTVAVDPCSSRIAAPAERQGERRQRQRAIAFEQRPCDIAGATDRD